jgi:hypothetical protein
MKPVAVFFLLFSLFQIGGAVEAQAGGYTSCQNTDPTCELYQKQQNAPAYNGPLADGGPVRCVYVVSDEASALVLREGNGTTGAPITSWRRASLKWSAGKINGHAAMFTQICFSQQLLYRYDVVTLCGEKGHSLWRNENIAFVREHDVKKSDPACVGGKGWCSYRGL